MLFDTDATEEELACSLRSMCHENGIEKEKLKVKTAQVFYKLGCIYANKAYDDPEENQKVCFIRSAVFFNAAISRNPDNVDSIKADLHRLCSQILKCAETTSDVNLIDISEEVQEKVRLMRKCVNDKLEELKCHDHDEVEQNMMHNLEEQKISDFKTLQQTISSEYKNIMKFVAKSCDDFLNIPCRYTLVGMGSLAREEITPYSDFENIILLEDGINKEQVVEYFRWYAVVFQIILINLGETIIPSVGSKFLNNFLDDSRNWFYDQYTIRGISFDGFMPKACKSPLGRFYKIGDLNTIELIKPVSEMASYMHPDEGFENGFHLADVLMQTCYVFGDEDIYALFCNKKKEILDDETTKKNFLKQLSEQVDDDKKNFEMWQSLGTLHSNFESNMKKIVYRGITIFVSALGKLYDIDEGSSFEIIVALRTMQVLSSTDAHQILLAVSLACEVRVRHYMKKNSQRDVITKTVSTKGHITDLFDLIGENNTIKFFDVTLRLQCSLPDFSMSKPKSIGLKNIPFTVPGIYYLLNQYEKSIELYRLELEQCGDISDENTVYVKFRIGHGLFNSKRYREAVDEFLAVICTLEHLQPLNIDNTTKLFKTHIALGNCYKNLKMYDKSLYHFEEVPDKNYGSADLNNLGAVFLKRKDFASAKAKFEAAIRKLKESGNKMNGEAQKLLALFRHNIGRCFYEQNDSLQALKYFEEALKLTKAVVFDYDHDKNFAVILYNIGRSHLRIGNIATAINHLNLSLDIQKRISSDSTKDPSLADIYHYLGLCKMQNGDLTEAMRFFEDEKSIRVLIPMEENTNEDDKENCLKCLESCQAKLNK